MSLTVAVANQKGGVGKTTTAINLGAELAMRDVRCLLVDLDSQANATAALGLSRNYGEGETAYDLLIDGVALVKVAIETAQPGLMLVPASPDLAGAEVELVPLMAREFRLRRALEAADGF